MKSALSLWDRALGFVASRLTLATVVWLVLGLSISTFVVWGFAGITEEVLEGETQTFDEATLFWISANTPPALDGTLRFVTSLGYYTVVAPLLAVLILVFRILDWRFSAMFLLASTIGGVFLTTALKATIRRDRPEIIQSGYEAGFFSFPSGHATVAVGFYGALTLILAYHLRGVFRWTAVALGILLILAIGYSRMYLGVHYPSDILAGYLAAPLWLVFIGAAYLAWLSIRGIRSTRFRRRKQSADDMQRT